LEHLRLPGVDNVVKIRYLFVALAMFLFANPLWARPEILDEWHLRYPDAPDALNNCQLCHENPSGGNGWNSYGWTIRSLRILLGSTSEAIEEAESSNADNDTGNSSNLLEIQSGTQPGWSVGSGNTIRYLPGTLASKTISASSVLTDPLALLNLDLPAPLTNPFPSRIATGAEATTTTIASGVLNAEVTLTSPITATSAPGLTNYLFVADQIGKIYKVDLTDTANTTEFIDISNFLPALNSGYDERGLLGLAFHPDFASNGLFYTYHSEELNPTQSDFPLTNALHQSVVSEWLALNPADPSTIGQASSKRDLLRIDQPANNHNGGAMVFDGDNNLLVALGDGGSADDSFGNGSNPLTPLGSILRIDPMGTNSANNAYGIPSDNPFLLDGGKLDEIYAYGFRNPYTLTRDTVSDNIYSGDVGQGDIEEVNRVTAGGNYGWNSKEGSFYFYPNLNQRGFVSSRISTRASSAMVDPILEYDHDEGISVIGGPVYRGSQLPSLAGTYLFGDWAGSGSEGRLFFSTDFVSKSAVLINGGAGLNMFLTGFGEDGDGEVYLLGKTQLGPSGSSGLIKKLTSFQETEPVLDSEEICIPITAANGKIAVVCL